MKASRRLLIKAATITSLAPQVCAAGLATLAAPAFAQRKTLNLKVGSNVPLTHPINLRLGEAVEQIRNDTDGRVQIRVFPNSQLGSDTDMLSQVRSGGLDFLTAPGVILANLVPLASLNSVAFAFPDYPSVWKAMDGDLGRFIRAQIEKAGLVPFDKVWDNGFRHITGNRAYKAPGELVDVKIRVPPSPLLVSLFKSLKAAPTPINFNELYSALQTRVVEAQENPLPIVATAKLFEVQKVCSLTGHIWDGYWLLSGKRLAGSIPAELRDIIARDFDAAAVKQRADSEKLALDLQQDLGGKGMEFVKIDTAPFRSALRQAGFYGEWKDKFGAEAWTQLEAAVGQLT